MRHPPVNVPNSWLHLLERKPQENPLNKLFLPAFPHSTQHKNNLTPPLLTALISWVPLFIATARAWNKRCELDRS